MVIFLFIVVFLILFVILFVQQPRFGRIPRGQALERIKKSPNYRKGAFQNRIHTPNLTEGVHIFDVFKEFFFADKKRTKPKGIIPSMKTDLLNLDPNKDVLVWFGHSSYFMQVDGKKILVDPVLTGSASPISYTTRAFKGTDPYTPEDIPEIDFLFITHDHWDHLDYKTLISLRPRVKRVICGLGTGPHLLRWGFHENIIIEKDWNETVLLGENFIVHTIPARHFSGRSFFRNKSLWLSFVLKTPHYKIYIGGDSGYDTHFAETGKLFGPFDLAILENGQYDKSWKYIHMMPKEVVQAAKDLNAKRFLPVHSAKFGLSNHDWDEPLKKVTLLNADSGRQCLTPMIGEEVRLNDPKQTFSEWWEGVQ